MWAHDSAYDRIWGPLDSTLFAPSQLNYLPFEANTPKHRWLRKALEALRTAQASLATATREEGDRTNAAIATEREHGRRFRP